MRTTTSFALMALTLVGCAPRLTRRHAEAESAHIPDLARITASTTVLPVEEQKPPAKTVYDLEGRGEAAAIQALIGPATAEPLSVLKSLLSVSAPNPPRSGVLRLDRRKARVVTNLIHRPFAAEQFLAGDRIEWAEVTVKLGTSAFRVVTYDKVDTGYETVDLGTLTRTANWTMSGTAGTTASTGLSAAPTETTAISSSVTNTASATASGGEALAEEVALRQRFTSFAVSLLPDGGGYSVVREGVVGVDLTGSTAVDIQVEATDPQSTQVFVIDVPKGANDRVKLNFGMASYSPCSRFSLQTTATAVIRHITGKGHTLTESDDKVIHEGISSETTSTTLELEPIAVYYIKAGKDRVQVSLGGAPKDLVFLDADEAREARTWLAQNWAQLDARGDVNYPLSVPHLTPKPDPGATDPGFSIETLVLNDKECAPKGASVAP